MWGKNKKQQTKIIQGRVTEKKIGQRRSEEKKFLRSELHRRPYSPEGHLGSHFLLQF